MTLAGVFTRDQAARVISKMKEAHGMRLQEIPPRVVLGTLKSMDVPVEAIGKGVKVRFTPTLKPDGFTMDMKISHPSVGIHGTGKPLEMQVTLWDGQSFALDQVISRDGDGSHHVYLMVSAEALEYSTRTTQGDDGLWETSKKPLSEIMGRVMFPELVLHEATLAQALNELETQYLRALLRDQTLWRHKITFGIRPIVALSNTSRINLELHDVPMIEALRYVTELAGTTWKAEGNTVIVDILSSEEGMEMLSRSYKVPADFAERLDHAEGHRSLRDVLAAQGVAFPEGARAALDGKAGQLSITATPADLRLVSRLVEKAWNEPVDSVLSRARRLIIPKIDFRNVTLEESLDFIAQKSRAADSRKRGARASLAPGCQTHRKLTLSVENVSAIDAYFYAAKLTGHQVKLDRGRITIEPDPRP